MLSLYLAPGLSSKWQRPLFLSSPAGPQILDSSKSAPLPPPKKTRISCPYRILAHYHKSWLSAVRLSSLVDWHQKYPPISLVTQVSTKTFIFFLASAPPSKSLVSHPLAGRGRFAVIYSVIGASLGTQMVKNLPAMQEAWVWSLGGEDVLEKGMATHSGILAWRIPCTEEPGGLLSMGSQRVGHKWVTVSLFFILLSYWFPSVAEFLVARTNLLSLSQWTLWSSSPDQIMWFAPLFPRSNGWQLTLSSLRKRGICCLAVISPAC